MIDNFLKELAKLPTLQKLLQIDGVVLAGGAIRDMMVEKDPKDFDLFFLNQEALNQVREILGEEDECTNYTDTYHSVKNEYLGQFGMENNEITIQLIHKHFFNNEQEVFKDFDFKNVQLACSKKGVFIPEESIIANSQKKVEINVITKPLDSFNRLASYAQKGYNVDEAYYYILDVMQTQPSGIVLGAAYYEEE